MGVPGTVPSTFTVHPTITSHAPSNKIHWTTSVYYILLRKFKVVLKVPTLGRTRLGEIGGAADGIEVAAVLNEFFASASIEIFRWARRFAHVNGSGYRIFLRKFAERIFPLCPTDSCKRGQWLPHNFIYNSPSRFAGHRTDGLFCHQLTRMYGLLCGVATCSALFPYN